MGNHKPKTLNPVTSIELRDLESAEQEDAYPTPAAYSYSYRRVLFRVVGISKLFLLW